MDILRFGWSTLPFPSGGAHARDILAEPVLINLENSALTYVAGKNSPTADVTLTLTRPTVNAVMLDGTAFEDAVKSGAIQAQGDPSNVTDLMSMLDNFGPSFEVVEPKRQ
jgi:alkyl sulfatase BDS1-like metallo-beta-lactamase superfamily hydrolase